jgi:hypothetical protein
MTVRLPSFEAGSRPLAISSRILVSPVPVAFAISATLKNILGALVFIEAVPCIKAAPEAAPR